MARMKSLFLGILLIILLGIGGLVYRNAVEYPPRPITCPMDSLTCPDGTRVSRTGNACVFETCPPPNISLSEAGIAFALPEGFAPAEVPDAASVAAYDKTGDSWPASASIIVRRYPIDASSTALATIQKTAINAASGLPVSPTSFTSTVLGNHRFTVVSIERFEAVVDVAYYLARGTDVLRFDAVDRTVANWTSPTLDTEALPAHAALRALLSTLQGG